MTSNEIAHPEMAKWDPTFTELLINAETPVIKRWFRPEVRGLETFPSTGGALLVSNHSVGVLTPGWNVLAPAFYGKFGYDRRTGYIRSAMQAGVPIVPAVSIGGQETQLFLTRGNWLAKRLGLKRFRIEILPATIGFPFGINVAHRGTTRPAYLLLTIRPPEETCLPLSRVLLGARAARPPLQR